MNHVFRLPLVVSRLLTAVIGISLVIVTPGVGASLELTAPLDYQVYQRATARTGTISIAGKLSSSLQRTAFIETRIIVNDRPTPWTRLTVLSAGQSLVRADLDAPAGGWYRLELRLRDDESTLAETNVAHVGVGEVFVVTGQSNSANHGEEKQKPASDRVVTFTGQRWQPANDPQPGATGTGGSFLPSFGDAIAGRFNVPVGFLALGVGATSVREWLPHGTRFQNPPTLTGNVVQTNAGEWTSKGTLFANLVNRTRQLGPRGFRAMLWHQGESDANQRDASRTLPGPMYRQLMEQLIQNSQRDVGWVFPWFVAQVSYHTPEDPRSDDIREAQASLWKSGIALEGPDTDLLTGDLRDGGGKGIHFSAKGLKAHGTKWADKVSPWIERQLTSPEKPKVAGPTPRLVLPGLEQFNIAGRPAFVIHPAMDKRSQPQPWIFYAPTLPAYPDGAERWMHEQFLAAGIAVAGVDVGEAYGSPKSHAAFNSLYRELVEGRGFANKACLFGRSRGGLWVSSWAIAHPERVAGIIGIYPVFDFRTYPGLKAAAPAYELTPAELESRADEFNPIARITAIARAGIPAALIHGDVDKVVPLPENSGRFAQQYRDAGAESLVKLIVLEGQGHSFYEGFFHSQELVDFAITRARDGTRK